VSDSEPSDPVVTLFGAAVSTSSLYFTPVGEYVGTLAVAEVSLLLSATTYSMRSSRSIRENANTPGPSELYRKIWAPERNCHVLVIELRVLTDRLEQWVGLVEVVVGARLVRADQVVVSVARDMVRNMSSRASLSPPSPVNPCSSP
jgi:hypothetical protein